MANWCDPDEAAFNDWLKDHQAVADWAVNYPPWKLFRLKDTGHRCFVIAYHEDKTVTVAITAMFNLINFGRRVFGIDPADLTECELPAPGEKVGETLTRDEQFDYINKAREANGLKPFTREEFDEARKSNVPNSVVH